MFLINMKEIIQTLSVEDNFHSSAHLGRGFREILLDFQAMAIEDQEDKIVSFSQKLPLLDPLQILHQFNLNNQPNFYWENQENQEAIASIGAIKKLTIEAKTENRFLQVQKQIKRWQKTILHLGEFESFIPQNRFFCGFTFGENYLPSEFSPFPKATLILPQLQIIKKHHQCWGIQNFVIGKNTNIDHLLETYDHGGQWESMVALTSSTLESVENLPFNLHDLQQNLDHFRQAVISALDLIEKKHLSKLVIAHVVDLVATNPFAVIKALKNLRKQYQNCYIFAFGNGEGCHFLGASPERLLQINHQQLITDAIAGSAPRGSTPQEDFQFGQKLLNDEKERREHQAVVTFISQRLQHLGLTVQTAPTTLLKLSNIQHLWTPIYSPLSSYLHPLEIIAKLHPTPAVSGVPTPIACQEIQRYEPFDRSLYAAPIGWIDEQGNSQFVVGIRSALVMGNKARLYAGAGIVAGSNPDQEVAEIQLKLQAMLKTLL